MKYHVSPVNAISGLFRKNMLRAMMAFCLITMSVLSYGQSPEVRKALRMIEIGQTSKGVSALEGMAGTSSSNQYYLGLAYLRTGDKAKALAAFEKGISMNEKDGLNYAGKGHVKLLEKNTTEAKTHFDKALQISKSKDVAVLNAVAEGYLSDSKYVLDAINLLNKAKSINGTNPETHMLLGDAFLMQNNGGEAVNSYERAATADKTYAMPFYKIARVFQRSRNTELVMENLNKAITVDPNFAPAYKELGEAYYLSKQPDKAVEAAEKYVAIAEDTRDAKSQLAFFYFMAKKFDKAEQMFKEVASSGTASPTALKYRGYALVEQEKTQEAQQVLEQYFQQAKPEDITASDYAYYGKLLLEIKQDSLANENFARSLELDSAQQEILQVHGATFMRRRKFDQAIPVFKQLMSIRKQPLAQDLWSIGQAYYFNDQYMEADTAFTKLSEKQPTVTHGYLWAAKARAQVDSTGSQGIAVPMYEKFIEIASQNPEKNKKDLIEAYEYLGRYTLNIKQDVNGAKAWFDKILALDPANATAKEFMKILKEGQQQKGR